MEKIVWRWDGGVYVPFCPHCNELVYRKDYCVFCHAPYEWVEGDFKPTIIDAGEFRIVQATNNNIHIYQKNLMTFHAYCKTHLTEEALRKVLEQYVSWKSENRESMSELSLSEGGILQWEENG